MKLLNFLIFHLKPPKTPFVGFWNVKIVIWSNNLQRNILLNFQPTFLLGMYNCEFSLYLDSLDGELSQL